MGAELHPPSHTVLRLLQAAGPGDCSDQQLSEAAAILLSCPPLPYCA